MLRFHPLSLSALALAALFAAIFAIGSARGADEPGEEPLEIVVTSSGDADDAECPHETACTLRAAIEFTNELEGDAPVHIRFAEEAFGEDENTIAIETEPLPVLTRASVSIDAVNLTVVLDGSALAEAADGLVITGASSSVRGIAVRNFVASCVVLGGPDQSAQDLSVGGCATGIFITGDGATLQSSRVEGRAGAGTGILVRAGDVTIGGESAPSGNAVGNAAVGIDVGGGEAAFEGVHILRNRIGENADGEPAPLGVGVRLRSPGSGTAIDSNQFKNTTVAAIQVAPAAGGPESSANSFRSNTFALTSGMAIDLGGDGVRNPNGNAGGPNDGVHHPVITRATQSAIVGSAGPSCVGCTVELYAAHHEPGGADDYGTTPLGTESTDTNGSFQFDAPAVAPGDWLTALVTDSNGNTSEFGPSARVGDGVAQCGNVTLWPGWNHAGYFGSTPLSLANGFGDGSGVTAIYALEDGAGTYRHWFADVEFSRTLTTLEPGESYWFYAERPVTLASGFALHVALPVELKPGWNDFVYIGADAHPLDALTSIAGAHGALYRWANGTSGGGWERWLPDAPGFAQDIGEVESCATYMVEVYEPVTLTPLQP